MDKELALRNIKESLEDLCRATGKVEKRMHKEIILESLKVFEPVSIPNESFEDFIKSTEELCRKIDKLLEDE